MFHGPALTSANLREGLAFLVTLILSVTVHEFAHAWSAYRLGDDTAARLGRMTLNPIPHIDPIGTLFLPALRIFFPAIPLFGWAKPVPVNPARFGRKVSMGTGMMITALAGPVSNVILAVLCTVVLGLLIRFTPGLVVPGAGTGELLAMLIQLNVTLAVFNLIPIPPLDGSRIVDGLLPYRLRAGWEAFTRLSPFLLIGLFYAAPFILQGPMGVANHLLTQLLYAVLPSQPGVQ